VACIRLQGTQDCYTIDSGLWIDLLDWAQDNGWQPKHPRELYDDCLHHLTVSADDAANLADALEFIAGDLVLHELSDVSDRFLRDLVDSLLKLTIFFQQGSFRIDLPLAAAV
jgi:hypothetical protein